MRVVSRNQLFAGDLDAIAAAEETEHVLPRVCVLELLRDGQQLAKLTLVGSSFNVVFPCNNRAVDSSHVS